MKNNESNRERFIRIAGARTQKILDMIDLLGNCSNPYNYEYTPKDIEKMFNTIETALKASKARYTEANKKEIKFKF